MKMDK